MRNKEYHIIYIMYIKKLRAYKVGISEVSRINQRLKEIEKAFGKVDKSRSYMYFSHSSKTIKNLEKGMHILCWKYSKDLNQNGSGKTEFFKQDIEFYLKEHFKISKKMYNLYGPVRLDGKRNSYLRYIYSLMIIIPIIGYSLTYIPFS